MPEENQAETLSTTMTGATRSAETARALIRKTKRATRRRFPTEDKIRIVIESVRGRDLCRRVVPPGRRSSHDLLQVAERLHGGEQGAHARGHDA